MGVVLYGNQLTDSLSKLTGWFLQMQVFARGVSEEIVIMAVTFVSFELLIIREHSSGHMDWAGFT